jgi:hypothetical protein
MECFALVVLSSLGVIGEHFLHTDRPNAEAAAIYGLICIICWRAGVITMRSLYHQFAGAAAAAAARATEQRRPTSQASEEFQMTVKF